MFNSNKGSRERDERPGMPLAPPQPAAAQRGRGAASVIGADVTLAGNVTATADLHIDGRIEGDVTCGSLAQGSDSQIFGNVTADTARLAGAIEGAVRVRQLTVERSARITGDVEYESITIENGGHVDGRLTHMSQIEAAIPAKPATVAPTAPATGEQDG